MTVKLEPNDPPASNLARVAGSGSHRMRRALVLSAVVGLLGVACSASKIGAPGGAAAGIVVWHVTNQGTGALAPVADDSTVFFATATHDLVALNKTTGALRWKSRTLSAPTDFSPGASLTLVRDQVIYPDYDIVSFDRRTGARRWVFTTPDTALSGIFIVAASADGARLFAGSQIGVVRAISTADGVMQWETRVATDTVFTKVFSPAVADGVVIVGYQRATNRPSGGVVALDAETGAIRWRREWTPFKPRSAYATITRPAISRGIAVVGVTDGRVVALELGSGKTLWESPPLSTDIPDDTRPLNISGNVVVAGSDRSVINGYDLDTGALLWTTPTWWGSVLFEFVVDGRFAAFVSGAILAGIDAQTGKVLLRDAPPYPLSGLAAIDAKQIYVSGESGFWAVKRP